MTANIIDNCLIVFLPDSVLSFIKKIIIENKSGKKTSMLK